MKAFEIVVTHWTQQIKELFPNLHTYQQETLAYCVQGVLQSGNAVMQKVAETMWEYRESDTKLVSHERRMQRFVANERIDVDDCWNTFLEQVLPHWRGKRAIFVLDPTPYSEEWTIIYLGILVQSRVLPLAWCLMPQKEQWEQAQWQLLAELFARVSPSLQGVDCTLLADRGLSCLQLIQLCKQVGWHYVLRIKQEEWFRRKYRHFSRDWQQGQHVIKKEGDQWYGEVLLWKEHQWATWLSLCWEEGYEEPWILVSDLRASHARVKEYRRRMRVEATFQDHKSRGCLIECSRFKQREHLHRWLLVVYLATWWVAHLGCSCVHHGDRGQLDRSDRRDKGLLRIGRLWFKAILKKAEGQLSQQPPGRVRAQLANCLPFSHRQGRLFFSIYLR